MAFIIKELHINPASEHGSIIKIGSRLSATMPTIVAYIEDNSCEDGSGRVNTMYTVKDELGRTLTSIENVPVQTFYDESTQITMEQAKELDGELVDVVFLRGSEHIAFRGKLTIVDGTFLTIVDGEEMHETNLLALTGLKAIPILDRATYEEKD